MISNLVSLFISSRLQREPIYDALAYQDGIHLPSAATRQQRGGRQVASLMKPATETLPTSITVSEALNLSLTSQYDCWPACDKRGIVGVISKRKLKRVAHEDKEVKLVGDLVDGHAFPDPHADQSLHMALERMEEAIAHEDKEVKLVGDLVAWTFFP